MHKVAFCAVIISEANIVIPISKQHIVQPHPWAVKETSRLMDNGLENSNPELSSLL